MASFASLPPEIVGHILSFCARPTISHGRVTDTSPLLATSLVSRAWRRLSQHLLFNQVALNGTLALSRWAQTEASQSTVQLAINLTSDHPQSGPTDLAGLLWAHLAGCEIGDQHPVEVLELELARGLSVCDARLAQLARLEGNHPALPPEPALVVDVLNLPIGLRSFSINAPIVTSSVDSLPSRLRHLRLAGHASNILSHPLTALPQLTHLTIDSLSDELQDLGSLFPALAYLDVRRFSPSTQPIPPSVSHFATSAQVDPSICRALPARLARLTISLTSHRELGSIQDRWFPRPNGPDPADRLVGLGTLTLLTLGQPEPGSLALDWLPAVQRARAEEKVALLSKAGCRVECKYVASSDALQPVIVDSRLFRTTGS